MLQKIQRALGFAVALSSIVPAYAQTANNSLAISWSSSVVKSGSVTTREGQPNSRIVYTDTNSLTGNNIVSYPHYVNMWTNDGGVRGPADSDRSAFGGGSDGTLGSGAEAGVSLPTPLRPGKYTAVGLFSKAYAADRNLPTIDIGNVPVGAQCDDDMAGTFTLSSITVEKLPNRFHVMKLTATIDGKCSANRTSFHVTMSADEPSLGGVLVDPPAADGSGDGGTGGNGGTGGEGGAAGEEGEPKTPPPPRPPGGAPPPPPPPTHPP